MKQYEIRWATLPQPVGRRPVLLLTRDSAYAYLHRIVIAEVTSVVRGIPVEVPLGRREGLDRPSVANLDSIHVVPRAALGELVGRLGPSRFVEVKRALGYALGWEELKLL